MPSRTSADDDAFGAFGLIAEEFRAADFFADAEPHRLVRRLARARPRRARLLALLLHGVGERRDIDADAARPQRVLGEVERKAVGVVQRERGHAVEHVAFLERLARLVEDRQATLERAAEAGFFELQRLGDHRVGAIQFRKGQSHLAHQHRHEAPHQRVFGAEQFGVAHAAAHDAAQYIAATLVRRQHTFGDQERRRAQMVGDDAMRRLLLAIRIDAGEIGDGLDQRLEQVDVVVAVDALENCGDALEPHAGIDREPGKVDARIGVDLLELHEDEIPEFKVTVAVLLR